MKAINVVRFKVKPGREQEFIDYNRDARRGFTGFLGGSLVKTGDQSYCMVGEWTSHAALVAARPDMIATLDGMRHLLEDLGGGLGITDPASGDVVVVLPAGKATAAKKKAKKTAKPAAKKSAAKKSAAKKKK